jgi:hypothetical protein
MLPESGMPKTPGTERQIAAARANGAKSRGPKTPQGKRASAANAAFSTGPVAPEGKARSSRNAIRHGLLADSTVFDGESEERFFAFLAALEAELQPEPGIEASQVEVIAVAHWRRMRLWSVEKVQYFEETAKRLAAAQRPGDSGDEPAITQLTQSFRSLSDESRAMELLNRYESRYSREYQRALACFKNHRADKQPINIRERAEAAARKSGESR